MSLHIFSRGALFATAPQAAPDDMAQVAGAGFATVVNNRPDFEAGAEQPTAQAVQAAAQASGLDFYNLPFASSQLTPDLALEFARIVGQARKPVLAYCRTGTRSGCIYDVAVELGYLDPANLSFIEPDAD